MAERFNFTKAQIEGLPQAAAGKRDYYHDADGPQSISGLVLMVTATGAKSFQVYRKMEGKPVRVTLGRYPDMTIEQARRKAKAALSSMAEGINPNAAEKAIRARGITLGEVYADYLQARKSLKPGSLEAYRYVMLDLKDWQSKPLGDITRDMVASRHRQIGQRSEARANLAMRLLRALFNFAAGEYEDERGNSLFPDNPVTRISHTRAWFRVERRRTVIKPHELRPWYEAVMGLPDTHPGERAETIRDYLLLLLFTGLRKVEGASLEWSDVDLIGHTLTIHDTKNREPHTLPLPDFLFDLLTRRRAQAAPGDRYVFASDTNRTGHIRDIQRQINQVSTRSGVTFTLHDLRRTFLTTAEGLDISAYAVKRLANHKTSGDVTGGYIVTDVERLRKPMQAITDFLLSAIGLRPRGEVVTLPRPTHEQAG